MKRILISMFVLGSILLFSACEDEQNNEIYYYIRNYSCHKVSISYTMLGKSYEYLLRDGEVQTLTQTEKEALSGHDNVDSVMFVFDDTIRMVHRAVCYINPAAGADIWKFYPEDHNILSGSYKCWPETVYDESDSWFRSSYDYTITRADYQVALSMKQQNK